MSTTIPQPAKYTLIAWEGATFRKRITVLQGDSATPPRDLSGYTATMNIRSAPDQSILFSLTTANGGITLGGVNGTIDLFISNTNTALFPNTWSSESAVYDLTITNTGGNGDVEPLLWGVFRLTGVS